MSNDEMPFAADHPAFRSGLERGELLVQRCDACGALRHPARFVCPQCLSEEHSWSSLSGRGVVETFVWYLDRLDPWPAGLPEPPYNVAVVVLDEGPRLLTNIVKVAFGELTVGDPVTARFDDVVLRFAKA
jgi:uncharacterized OB-fold protein